MEVLPHCTYCTSTTPLALKFHCMETHSDIFGISEMFKNLIRGNTKGGRSNLKKIFCMKACQLCTRLLQRETCCFVLFISLLPHIRLLYSGVMQTFWGLKGTHLQFIYFDHDRALISCLSWDMLGLEVLAPFWK
ncbi:hypothetical protein XENOCAPTIV_025202 [Xenoophorus captivus]|uniref:Uncharacterized protein n=1 Tax=Xenoophorus captivus TaxID=1517983 RepID=A0ABV0S0B0_9TELE